MNIKIYDAFGETVPVTYFSQEGEIPKDRGKPVFKSAKKKTLTCFKYAWELRDL